MSVLVKTKNTVIVEINHSLCSMGVIRDVASAHYNNVLTI